MRLTDPFKPLPPFRNPHLQTVLCSSRIRVLRPDPMSQAARTMVLTTDEGVRLLGSHSARSNRTPRGQVILLHGWEGSVDSVYVRRTGAALYERGYDVFRLNLRDHGDSHHLNQGLFYASALQEVFSAVRQAAELHPKIPSFLVGFSLGGNYALRIAVRCKSEPIENLKHVVSISPVLDPDDATDKIDSCAYIQRYFLKKWHRSLQKKQALFPHRYDFRASLQRRSVRSVTEVLISEHSRYHSAREYFSAYSLLGDALLDIAVPTTVLTAEDDPIISATHFRKLQLNGHTRLAVQPFGGHNGFIAGFSLRSYYERPLADLFDAAS
jgi:predicted alpha/beta-fold hydrolase